jgi:two-component system nitrate/nitrite sensor histidine kinase NarX
VARISHALGEGIAGLVAFTGRPIAVERVANDPRVSHHLTDPEGVCSLLQVPIQVEREVFGVFGVSYRHERTFTGAEERLLVALAERAAVAISNARQYQQAQDIAMMEERQRLARDLHDAVAQTLFAAGLNAQALPHLLAENPEEGQRCVEELQRLTWGALAEMRTVLVELRPAVIAETDLGDLLRQLSQAMTGRAPLLEIAVNSEGERKLPPEVQTVFYRVAQEALSNIVKHANATHAELRLIRRPDAVEISVADDGHGFDPLGVGGGHLGLGIMRERLESIGGTLSIDSAPDRGTRLRGTWADATAT